MSSRIFKIISIILLPLFMIVLSTFGSIFVVGYVTSFFTCIYALYVFAICILEDIKFLRRDITNIYDKILYDLNDTLVIYGLLLTLVSIGKVWLFIFLILIAFEFIRSGREAIKLSKGEIVENKLGKLLVYSKFTGLVLILILPNFLGITTLLLIPAVALEILNLV